LRIFVSIRGLIVRTSAVTSSGPQPLTIVYIEDNATNLDLVSRVLESTRHYRVIGAKDGSEGLRIVERERPALVLVDLDVPEMNGFEVARRLKSSTIPHVSSIPVAVVTANVLTNERQAALDAGCVAFIEKPFDIHEFRREIARLTGTESPDSSH
jgi:CheY-like chemotaxis protein